MKLLNEGASAISKVKFLQEAAIMAQFTHPNVISLYGVVSETEPVSSLISYSKDYEGKFSDDDCIYFL